MTHLYNLYKHIIIFPEHNMSYKSLILISKSGLIKNGDI